MIATPNQKRPAGDFMKAKAPSSLRNWRNGAQHYGIVVNKLINFHIDLFNIIYALNRFFDIWSSIYYHRFHHEYRQFLCVAWGDFLGVYEALIYN